MIENMNSAQTIFTIFFALYYAFSVGVTGKFQLFDTSAMCSPKKYPKSWRRFFLGLFFINFVPLFYFWIVINRLKNISGNIAFQNFWILLIIFLQSLFGFGLYRILFGLLIKKDKKGDFSFYDNVKYPKDKNPIQTELSSRLKSHENMWSHIIPGIIWFVVLCLLLFFFV